MDLGREVRMSKRDGMVLTMLDALRRQAGEICDQLIGTKHDLITELFDLDELLPRTRAGATRRR
jgi:hypothetical protein